MDKFPPSLKNVDSACFPKRRVRRREKWDSSRFSGILSFCAGFLHGEERELSPF